MNARDTTGAGDGRSLLGSAIALLFALLAIALLAHDARSQDESTPVACELSVVVCPNEVGR